MFGVVLFPVPQYVIVSSLALVFTIVVIVRLQKWIDSYKLKRYRIFLESLKHEKYSVRLFDELIEDAPFSDRINVFIRHDVDISLPRAVKMAKIEKEIGIHATYFFRMHAEKYTFEQAIPIIKQLHSDGYGIGLHYEVLSHTLGHREKAITLFEEDIKRLRDVVPTHTVCAHGARGYSNRDIWSEINHDILEVQSAYDLKNDKYLTDAGGKNLIDSEGNHLIEEIYSAKAGQVVQVLIHPDWWY